MGPTQRELSRRSVLRGAVSTGLLLAFHLPLRAAGQAAADTKGTFAPNAFIRIDPSGKVTLVMPQVEMGQGVYTAVAMILAEELDADFSRVVLEHAPPNDKLYGNPAFGIQVTGNSNSIRAFWKPLRVAGAAARAMLVQAAAQQWHVEPAGCTASNSEVLHAASGRKLSYGSLVERREQVHAAQGSAAEGSEGFQADRQVAQATRYAATKSTAGVVYGIDVMLPGMKFATLAASPVLGGKVGQVDESAAKTDSGCSQGGRAR